MLPTLNTLPHLQHPTAMGRLPGPDVTRGRGNAKLRCCLARPA